MSYFRRPSLAPFDPFDPRHSRDLVTTSKPGESGVWRCACGEPIEVQSRELPDLWAGRLFPNCQTCRAEAREQIATQTPDTVNALEGHDHDHHRGHRAA